MNNNRTLRLLLSALALLGTLVGFFLRRQQLTTELLSDGSLVSGSYLHIVLLIISLVLLAAFVALLLPLRPCKGYRPFFTATLGLNVLQIVAAVGLLCGNILLLASGSEVVSYTISGTVSLLLIQIMAPLGLIAAVCIALFALLVQSKRKPSAVPYMLVTLYLIVRLIVNFQQWNTDPSIHDYCFELFAAISTMLAFFHLGGFCLNCGKRRMSLFWCLCSVFFCGVHAADAFAIGALDETLINASLLLSSAVSTIQLLFPRGSFRSSTGDAK